MLYSNQEKSKFVLMLAECHGSYTLFCRCLRSEQGMRRNFSNKKSVSLWTKHFRESGTVKTKVEFEQRQGLKY